MNLKTTAILTTLIVSSMLVATAHANEFEATLSTDNLVDKYTSIQYEQDPAGGWNVIVIHTYEYHFDRSSEMPEQIIKITSDPINDIEELEIYEFPKDEIKFREDLVEKPKEYTAPEPTPYIKPELRDPESKLRDKLNECFRGLNEWAPIQENTAYETVSEFIKDRHFSKNPDVADLNRAYEECRGAKAFASHQLRQYLDLVVDDHDSYPAMSQPTVEATSPFFENYQDAKTDYRLQAEQTRAQEFMCSETGRQWKLCNESPEKIVTNGTVTYQSEAYGKYNAYRSEKQSNPDMEIAKAIVQMCDKYVPEHEHKKGTDRFPQWLEVCEP